VSDAWPDNWVGITGIALWSSDQGQSQMNKKPEGNGDIIQDFVT